MRAKMTCAFHAALFATIAAVGDDWPTYLHDGSRSGRTEEQIETPLVPAWTFHPGHAPDPAWTQPAKEAPRVRFDDAYHVAVADERVFFGCSADNKVYALDASSGAVVWSFFTGGPVRLAPMFSEARLYFGSDDGFAYCLDARTGREIWKTRAAHSGERVIGHGRIISLWPVRTGVLVADGVAYFGAGIFPSESIYICAADAASGSLLWRNDTIGERGPEQRFDGISPQGYLLASEHTLYAPSGRSMPAAFRMRDGKFLFYLDPGGKTGGNYALLTDDHLIAGVNDQRVYDKKSGKRGAPGYAWTSANRLIVAGNISYSLTDHQILALDRSRRAALLGERNKVAGRRQEYQKEQRSLHRQRYRLEKSDKDYDKRYAALSKRLEELRVVMDKLKRDQEELEDGAYRWKRDTECRDSMILAGKTIFAGGEGRVIAVDAENGNWLWTGDVQGRASGLAVAGGRLYVSTTAGAIHCFEQGAPLRVRDRTSPEIIRQPHPRDEWTRIYERAAERIVSETRVRRGFCLILGSGRGRLAFELAKRTDLQIYGVDSDPENVREARAFLSAAGLYGNRVTIDHGSLAHLSYPSYFANLIVSDELLRHGRVEASPEEMFRVLRPLGGVAMLGQPEDAVGVGSLLNIDQISSWLKHSGAPEPEIQLTGGVWAKVIRGPLPGAGGWTHLYADPANSANSGDRLVKTPLGIVWFGRPGPERMVERHARAAAPVSLDGRLFVEGENVVMAYDAYNGRLLWERDIPGAVRVRVDVDASNMAVSRRGLFVATRDRALRLDSASGQTLTTYRLPPRAAEARKRWGFLATADDRLFGSVAEPLLEEYGGRWQNVSEDPVENRRAFRRFNAGGGMWRYMQSWPDWGREDTWKGAVTSRMITSSSVFARDVESGELLWEYEGQIAPTSITIADGTVFFTDGDIREEEKRETVQARRRERGLLTYEAAEITDFKDYDVRRVVAIDAATGKERWRKLYDLTGSGGNRLGTAYSEGILFVLGHFSNHDGPAFSEGKLKWRRVTALSGSDGYVLWSRELDYLRRPFIMGDRLIIEPLACDIRTGELKTRSHPVTGEIVPWEFKRGGHSCGVCTASASTFFFRSDSINYYDIERDHGMLPLGGTRAGCWVNMIAANGLALLPEASAGCTCSFPIRSTIALAPRSHDRKWTIYASTSPMTPVRHWHINLGAPGDRKDEDGNMWFGYPRLGVGYGMKFSLKEELTDEGRFFARSFEGLTIRNTDRPWVYSSGVAGITRCVLPLGGDGQGPLMYRVRLGFSEPRHDKPGQRVFDVKLQGHTVLEDFDIFRAAGAKDSAVVREFEGIEVKDHLTIELFSETGSRGDSGAPLLNSIEVVRS